MTMDIVERLQRQIDEGAGELAVECRDTIEELVEALRAHVGEYLDPECSRCASDRALLAKIGGAS